ncbi:hypothetical protein [Vibrio phage VCPH]|nr:hypothetical protein [Vibrio phage VCPH]
MRLRTESTMDIQVEEQRREFVKHCDVAMQSKPPKRSIRMVGELYPEFVAELQEKGYRVQRCMQRPGDPVEFEITWGM